MAETLRPATAADAGECGRTCFEAFASICDAHNYPRDFPSPEIAAGLLGGMISHLGFYGEAFTLRRVTGLSQRETAERLKIGEKTVDTEPPARSSPIVRCDASQFSHTA